MWIVDLFEDENERDHWEAHQRTGYFGAQGAGCLFFARDTKRFLLSLRSYHVEQPGTYGTWGGAIDRGEDPLRALKREIGEEAGYHGAFQVEPMLVFADADFRYHNFLVIVPHEFHPVLNAESDGYVWCTYGRWPKPLHFGLVALFADPASEQLMMDWARSAGKD